MIKKTKMVEHWEGGGRSGYRAVIYSDDDGGSGYGENAMVGYWYGTREECEALDVNSVELYHLHPY